jgi:hypothetical protein
MDVLPMAAIPARRAMLREASSALPDAPVVPDDPAAPGPRLPTVRARLASVLHRVADAVTPGETH